MWGENPRFVEVVEAGYELGQPEDAWIRGIGERVHPVIELCRPRAPFTSSRGGSACGSACRA